MHQNKKKAFGFTLIEVMIAVAIFAVIGAILFPAVIQFIETRERVIAKHDQIENLQKTFLFMAKDFRYAANRLGKDEYGELGKATLSVGDDSLIDLTAMYPDLELGGLNVPRRVRWELDRGILSRIQSPVMDPDSDTRVFKQALLHGVEQVQVELSSVQEGRSDTSKKWDQETRLPDMVNVQIKMENDLEYERLFTMLGGDKLEAIAAATTNPADPNNPTNPGDQDGLDGDGPADGVGSQDDGSNTRPPGTDEDGRPTIDVGR